jgi:hypothetical protein
MQNHGKPPQANKENRIPNAGDTPSGGNGATGGANAGTSVVSVGFNAGANAGANTKPNSSDIPTGLRWHRHKAVGGPFSEHLQGLLA